MNKLCKPYICKNAFADDVADGIYDCKIKNYVGLMVFNNQIEVKHNKINTNDIKHCVQTFRKTFKEIGTLEPRRDKIPREKAMSVAEGIAHPLIVSGFP